MGLDINIQYFVTTFVNDLASPQPDTSLTWTLVLQVTDRYRLTGDVLDGQMDLDILNVRRTDSGPYCCRVDIDGIFNDKKVIMNLRVVKALVTSSPSPTTTTTTQRIMDPLASTGDTTFSLISTCWLIRKVKHYHYH
uniref:hepatitis A virus cellular receptor 1 homolog n=1 Tax=Monopterus albus TaxID=43700 RepID=UPI0009B4A11E|nr:hepatitis A virus cellular receptor 1 homolog [Monopterus albus]